MSDENESEIELDLEEDIPSHMEVLPPEKIVRTGVGMKTVLVFSMLAALAGAFGGAAISQAFNLKSSASDNVQSQLESFSQEKDSLRRDVSQLEETVNSLKVQKPAELSSLETRMKKLETERKLAPAPADDNAYAVIGARIEALENNADMQLSTGNTLPEDILGRIEMLEKQAPNADLNEIVDRLDRLEVQSITQPQKSQTKQTAPVAEVQKILIPPFPRDAVLDAAAKSGQSGWLNRTLDKHVKIRDANEVSPENIADQIQAHLDIGDYSEAVALFDTLPSKSRSAGKAWRDAVAADIKANP